MRGEAWPHAMAITVDEKPTFVLELLWIREAYDLQPEGEDLPPLLTDTPARVIDPAVSDAERSRWEAAWSQLWHGAVAHAGGERGADLFDEFEELRQAADGSPGRADLIFRIVGPNWHDAFGDAVFRDRAYSAWERKRVDALIEVLMTGREEDSPERRDLDALVPAWRAGLTKFVSIPCRGEFTRRIGPSTLLVTDATRNDSASFRRALATFG
jgi:hypothetical protein